eukprot:18154-Heterococcus_DN1.PRE.3
MQCYPSARYGAARGVAANWRPFGCMALRRKAFYQRHLGTCLALLKTARFADFVVFSGIMGSGKTYLAASVLQVRERGDDRVIFKPLGRGEQAPTMIGARRPSRARCSPAELSLRAEDTAECKQQSMVCAFLAKLTKDYTTLQPRRQYTLVYSKHMVTLRELP